MLDSKIEETISRDLQIFTHNTQEQMQTLYTRYQNKDFFKDAIGLILATQQNHKRFHVSGIGKMHHAANYCASLLSSLGYLTYFLDGTEATHGSSGQVDEGDLVICLSYYGSVAELNRAITTLKRNGAHILSLTGFDDSWIAKESDVHLNVFVEAEGDSLNKPPRMSILSTLFCIQCLSICLQSYSGLEMEQYLKWHPGGAIGQAGTAGHSREV